MPLSDHEQRMLDQIESALYAEGHIQAAGSVGHKGRRGRCDRGDATWVVGESPLPLRAAAFGPPSGAWRVTLGTRRWIQRRRLSWSQRRASPFVRVRGPRDEGAHTGGRSGKLGAHVLVLGGCTHLGLRETAVPFAGGRATGGLQGARRVRDHASGYRARMHRVTGFQPWLGACSRHGGARSGASRGFEAVTGAGPWLDRIGPMRWALSRAHWHRLVVSRASAPKGAGAQDVKTRRRRNIRGRRESESKRCSGSRHTRDDGPQLVPARRSCCRRRRAASGAREARMLRRSGRKPARENRCPWTGL